MFLYIYIEKLSITNHAARCISKAKSYKHVNVGWSDALFEINLSINPWVSTEQERGGVTPVTVGRGKQWKPSDTLLTSTYKTRKTVQAGVTVLIEGGGHSDKS